MPTLPKVGETVTVTVKQDNRMFLVWRPETVTYAGTVVPSFPWLDPDEFCMSTGLLQYPVRTLRLSNVSKIVLATGKELEIAKQIPALTNQWTIKGSAGAVYFVSRIGNTWTCTCIAGQHAKLCKHVKEAQRRV